jgi:hypothetical protein
MVRATGGIPLQDSSHAAAFLTRRRRDAEKIGRKRGRKEKKPSKYVQRGDGGESQERWALSLSSICSLSSLFLFPFRISPRLCVSASKEVDTDNPGKEFTERY